MGSYKPTCDNLSFQSVLVSYDLIARTYDIPRFIDESNKDLLMFDEECEDFIKSILNIKE